MAAENAPVPEEDTSGHIDLPASELAEILAGQVAGLRGLTMGLEEALSASLCSCKPLTEDAFLTLQRIDYMRQALKDLEGILQRFGPSLDWAEGHGITQDALHASVDMGDSIKPILKASRNQMKTDESSDLGAGDLDLW